jgi:hypothetical protein
MSANLTQSSIFLVRYHTKIRDAAMLMPAIVSSMPMPSYAYSYRCACLLKQQSSITVSRLPTKENKLPFLFAINKQKFAVSALYIYIYICIYLSIYIYIRKYIFIYIFIHMLLFQREDGKRKPK